MLRYPVVTIKWKAKTWWSVWHFTILGWVCKHRGHIISKLYTDTCPGYVFCQRCRTQFRLEEAKWRKI